MLQKPFRVIIISLLLSLSLNVNSVEVSDLRDISLVDLLNLKVYSVHKSSSDFFTTAAAVSIITRQDIENSSAQNVSDLLVSTPGLYTFQHQSNLSSTGIRDDAQVFVSTSLVLLDGIPIYSVITGGPEFHALALALSDIERIEIIRGSGGNSWGANASSGIINIITRHAEEVIGSNGHVSVSSRLERSLTLQYGFSGTDFNGYFTLGLNNDPGFENEANNESQYKRRFIRFRGDLVVDNWSFLSNVSVVSYGSLDEDFFTHAGGVHTNTSRTESLNTHVSFQGDYQFDNEDKFSIQTSYKVDDIERRFLPADYDTTQLDIELRFKKYWEENNVTHLTSNYRAYDIAIVDYIPNLYGYDPNEKEITLTSIGVNHIMLLTEKFSLEFGGRIEDYSILKDTLYSPGTRASYKVTDSFFIWGNYTRSYQFPNFVQYSNYLYLTGIPSPLYLRGSTELDAEENNDYGFGARWKGDKDLLDFTMFYKETIGQIRSDNTQITDDPGLPLTRTLPYTNTVDVDSEGVELTWTHHLTDDHFFKIDLTYFTSEAFLSAAAVSPTSYSFVPDYKVSWTHHIGITDNITFRSALTWYNEFPSENINGIFADPNMIDSHMRLDANLKYAYTDELTIDFGVKNILSNDEEALYPISTQHPEKVEPSVHISAQFEL